MTDNNLMNLRNQFNDDVKNFSVKTGEMMKEYTNEYRNSNRQGDEHKDEWKEKFSQLKDDVTAERNELTKKFNGFENACQEVRERGGEREYFAKTTRSAESDGTSKYENDVNSYYATDEGAANWLSNIEATTTYTKRDIADYIGGSEGQEISARMANRSLEINDKIMNLRNQFNDDVKNFSVETDDMMKEYISEYRNSDRHGDEHKDEWKEKFSQLSDEMAEKRDELTKKFNGFENACQEVRERGFSPDYYDTEHPAARYGCSVYEQDKDMYHDAMVENTSSMKIAEITTAYTRQEQNDYYTSDSEDRPSQQEQADGQQEGSQSRLQQGGSQSRLSRQAERIEQQGQKQAAQQADSQQDRQKAGSGLHI